MARPAEPGRNALLSAGFEVAAARGLAGLSVNAVVDTAGMAKGSFYNHFPTRRDYLVALHRDYHERLNADVAEAIGDAEQLCRGVGERRERGGAVGSGVCRQRGERLGPASQQCHRSPPPRRATSRAGPELPPVAVSGRRSLP